MPEAQHLIACYYPENRQMATSDCEEGGEIGVLFCAIMCPAKNWGVRFQG